MIDKVDYIIKSSNELPYLIMMLASLKYNNADMWKIANIKVFANNCNDGTKEWCDKNDIWCEEVSLPGLYNVWNYGAKLTNNDWIIFSASDFVLSGGFWKAILTSISKEYGYYHWSGTCIDNGISYPHPDIPQRRWFNRNCGDNWKEFDYNKFVNEVVAIRQGTNPEVEVMPNETQYCPFICTREHYNLLNGFNTALGDYPTDIDHDFVRRGKELGRECGIVLDSYFYHFGKKSLLRRDNIKYDWRDFGAI